jgi:hypothetical protein
MAETRKTIDDSVQARREQKKFSKNYERRNIKNFISLAASGRRLERLRVVKTF